MLGSKFLGKTRIPHRKNTADVSPVRMNPPKEVLLPVEQHLGAPAIPTVKAGDTVKVGQLIADASGQFSSPIYASVSGTVKKIESYLKSNGKTVDAIRIESDGLMTPYEEITPPQISDIDSLISAIRASGLVGLGGAGFPTAVKFEAVKEGKINTVILNGAECEPYITVDAQAMTNHADLIREGIELLERVAPEIDRYIVGIENNKPHCIENMKECLKDNKAVSIVSLPSLYPQGAEKVIIYNTTGLVVPEGKLPADVGVIVINVSTLAFIAKYVKTGMPLVEKHVTIDGSAVKNPSNVIAPIGTSFGDIIEFTGGFNGDPGKIIHGGPMTGFPIYSLDEPVVKTTSAIVALSKKDAIEKKTTSCIHCGRCIEACPVSLNPTAFCKSMNIENSDEKMKGLEDHSINLCIECGSCSFVCPANRPLVETIRMAKSSLRDYKAHKSSLK